MEVIGSQAMFDSFTINLVNSLKGGNVLPCSFQSAAILAQRAISQSGSLVSNFLFSLLSSKMLKLPVVSMAFSHCLRKSENFLKAKPSLGGILGHSSSLSRKALAITNGVHHICVLEAFLPQRMHHLCLTESILQ